MALTRLLVKIRPFIRQMSQTAFISGHVYLPSSNYFTAYYEKPISVAILAGHHFIMGPSPGIDAMSLRYLIDQGVCPSRITIYLAEFERHTLASRIQWFVDLGGNVKVEGSTFTKRDEVMTRDSDYDILRYMPIEEQRQLYGGKYRPRVSGTEKNDRRRKGLPLHVNHDHFREQRFPLLSPARTRSP